MLLQTRRFLPLFITQFLGAFNDNVFKNALVMLITYQAASKTNGNAQILVTLAAGLFMLPYLLFSATAGQLADKYDRAKLARIIKTAEIVIMAVAAIGFYTNDIYFLLFVLFCLGTQATFFGPIKYALLPQHLHDDELISGNAYIEAGTFLAILIGTISGGLLVMQQGGEHWIAAAVLLVSLGGYAGSRYIPVAPAPMHELTVNWNIAQETLRIINNDRKNRRVFLSILGISWFWLVGATYLSQFPTYAKDVLQADAAVVTLFLTVFSLGIGIGSFLCNLFLKGQIKSTLAPWAAAGISAFTIDLYFASAAMTPADGGALMSVTDFMQQIGGWHILIDLLGIAVCGGLYIVPLYAIMQHDSDPNSRARTIACNNIVNALFMVLAAIATMLMLKAEFSVPQVFLTVGVVNALVAVKIMRLKRS